MAKRTTSYDCTSNSEYPCHYHGKIDAQLYGSIGIGGMFTIPKQIATTPHLRAQFINRYEEKFAELVGGRGATSGLRGYSETSGGIPLRYQNNYNKNQL
jgi:hypothetical protein